MDPVRNPYNPGAGTPPPALTGRDELLRDFRVALERTKLGRPGKSIMPIGLRGVGKTVLLNRFVDDATALGYKVAAFEAPKEGDLARQLSTHVRRILLEYDRLGALSTVVRRALKVFKSFSLTLPDGSSVGIDVDPELGVADSKMLAEDLSDLFLALGAAAADRKGSVLIAIDEVQYLSSAEFGALITAIHRTTQRALPVIVVGAGLPQLPGLAGEVRSYAERLFTFPKIGSLPPEAARAAIQQPASDQGVMFSSEALTAILDVTGCYPFFLQEWAYATWNYSERSPITADDVRLVSPKVQERLDSDFFRVRFDQLTPTERRFLRAMAELGPGPHRSAEIAATYGAKPSSLSPMRSNLISKGMIYSPQYGDTAFTVPLFDAFLRRSIPGFP
jgi:hypothetical protein